MPERLQPKNWTMRVEIRGGKVIINGRPANERETAEVLRRLSEERKSIEAYSSRTSQE